MRDVILVCVTALLSAAGGAFLAMSLHEDAPATAEDKEQAIEVGSLLERVRLLEEKLATDARARRPDRDNVATTTLPAGDDRPRATLPLTSAAWREHYEDRLSPRERQTDSRLRNAGWNDQEIASLDAMRERASLEFEQRQYEIMRQRRDRDPDAFDQWADRARLLRAELGDERYAQFLEAQGRSTTVRLDNVLAGSAGAAAGLQPGDTIRRYGSERVFSEQDLRFAILRGEAGEPVTLEFERNGSVFHVTVPRGPLGISDPLHP